VDYSKPPTKGRNIFEYSGSNFVGKALELSPSYGGKGFGGDPSKVDFHTLMNVVEVGEREFSRRKSKIVDI
jgi:hypothetical protein